MAISATIRARVTIPGSIKTLEIWTAPTGSGANTDIIGHFSPAPKNGERDPAFFRRRAKRHLITLFVCRQVLDDIRKIETGRNIDVFACINYNPAGSKKYILPPKPAGIQLSKSFSNPTAEPQEPASEQHRRGNHLHLMRHSTKL